MIYKDVKEAIKFYAEEKRKHEENTQEVEGMSSEIVNKFFQNW